MIVNTSKNFNGNFKDVNDRDSVLFINPAAPNQWRCFGNSVMQLLGRTPLYRSICEFNRFVPQAENSVVKTFLNLLKEKMYIGERRDVRLVVEKVARSTCIVIIKISNIVKM